MRSESAARRATDNAFRTIRIDGLILDIGGAPENAYHGLIGGNHKIVFSNIDEKYRPDMVFDAEKPWPVPDVYCDAVIISHVLEHLYRPNACLAGAFKALKPGGRLVGAVPFLYRIHAGPSDYFRYTAYALERMFLDAGFVDIEIRPLCTGAFSVAFDLVTKPLARFGCLHLLLQKVAEGLDSLAMRIRPHGDLSNEICPSGYFFMATKPQ